MEATNSNVTDLTYLKELAKGDNAFIKEMLVVFMEQTPEAIGNLEKYYGDKNWKMLRAVAHKMKPSFTFVGLKELTPVINLIEEYAEKEIHFDLLPEMISKVKTFCNKAMVELEEQKKSF